MANAHHGQWEQFWEAEGFWWQTDRQTEEQMDIYDSWVTFMTENWLGESNGKDEDLSPENTFCKESVVLYSNQSNTAFEPCGHLICHECFDIIRQATSQISLSCPFCRMAIAGGRPVIAKDTSQSIVHTAFGDLCELDDQIELDEEIDLVAARRSSIREGSWDMWYLKSFYALV